MDYAAIFERSANPYAVIDRELRCVAANAAFCWVFYRSREQLVGASLLAVFDEDPEAQRARLRAAIEGVFATGQTAVLASVPGSRLDLRDRVTGRSWGATYAPVRDAAGRVTFVLWHHGPLVQEPSVDELRARERGELADCRRAARGQIERAHALIEYAVAQRRALQSLRGALQGAAAALGTGEPAPGALAELRCTARRVVRTMMTLGEAIHIVTGRLSIDVALVDIAAVARAAADLARHEAERRGVAFDVEIESPAAVRGHASWLQCAIEALLGFAIEHTRDDGRVVLRVATRRGATELVLEMTSTDEALAPPWVPGVFARLVPSGGGAGLPWLDGRVARYVVEAHAGELVAAGGGAGRGATLTVRLPASAERIGLTGLRANGSPDLVPAVLEALRVLVVSDDAGVSTSLGAPLERCQAQVTSVATEHEAMRLIVEQPPDVVLDVRWSDGGAELLRRIRELPDDRGGRIPVIALNPAELAGVPPRAAGARRTTGEKPVEPVQWLARVTEAASEPSPTNERHDHRRREPVAPVAGVDYAAIFEASPNPYAVIDPALRYAVVNPAYCRVIGRRRDRLIHEGLLAQFGDPIEEDLAQQLRIVLARVFAAGHPEELPALPYRPFPVVEQAYQRAWRGWRATHLPLYDASRRVALVLQHQAPLRRRPLLQELARGEGTEHLELERAVQRQTARALTLLDVFPVVRSELVSASVGLESALGRLSRAAERSSPGLLESLVRGARSLDEIARDASDLLGVVTSQDPLATEPIDLGEVVRAAAEHARREEPDVAVDTAIPVPAVVSGHRALLSRMVHGLLSSAIAVAPPDARIALRVAARSNDVELAMQGVGMNLRPDRMPHLFSPLHLFDSSIETGSVGGRLARYIIEAHGGELVAESNGVAVRLPRASRAPATEAPGPAR